MSEKQKEYDDEGRVIRENRSALKREREKIKQFGESLLKLPNRQYELLPINDNLIKALNEGKRLSGNAYQRHLNYITRLLAEQNVEEIQRAHEHINHPFMNDGAKNRRIQKEIERLLHGDTDIFAELIARYADFDIQYVRQLVREAQKYIEQKSKLLSEDEKLKPGKHQRRLQKYLQGLSLNYD